MIFFPCAFNASIHTSCFVLGQGGGQRCHRWACFLSFHHDGMGLGLFVPAWFQQCDVPLTWRGQRAAHLVTSRGSSTLLALRNSCTLSNAGLTWQQGAVWMSHVLASASSEGPVPPSDGLRSPALPRGARSRSTPGHPCTCPVLSFQARMQPRLTKRKHPHYQPGSLTFNVTSPLGRITRAHIHQMPNPVSLRPAQALAPGSPAPAEY